MNVLKLVNCKPGTHVHCNFGAGMEFDSEYIIVSAPLGQLDEAIGFKELIPVVNLKTGVLIMRNPHTPCIPV